MTKHEFLETFGADIRLAGFMTDAFLACPDLEITAVEKNIDDILQLYVPRYQKNGELVEGFLSLLQDPVVRPVRVAEALPALRKWDLHLTKLPKANELRSIPVATDAASGKTLILDGNHTLCGLMANAQIAQPVSFVEIKSNNIAHVVLDFLLINR